MRYSFTKKKPDEKGVYIWRSGDVAFSVVLVHKRPTAHSPAGELCGTILNSNSFYNDSSIESAWAGEWLGPITNEPHEFPEDVYRRFVIKMAESLNGAEKETLRALLKDGPLFDGDVPSKRGRDSLLEKELAVKIIVKGNDGYQAVTYLGRDVFKYIKTPEHLTDK